MEGFERHARQIARIAGEIAMRHFRTRLDVDFKADDSPVTRADKAVEAAIRAYIGEHFPGDGIYGEEQGHDGLDQQSLWVIDPIDGTRSFLSGNPLFGVLLAHLADGTPRMGMVAMPALGEVYLGSEDGGATCNGTPIASSGQTDSDRAILYINEGDKIHAARPDALTRLLRLGRTRRFCYDCYPYALLASGHVDAVVDYDLQPYDTLPLMPLIRAAGGILTDWSGNEPGVTFSGPVVAAASPELHDAVLTALNG